MKPYVKSTPEGKIYIDTDHPEWIAYFTNFIKKVTRPKEKNKITYHLLHDDPDLDQWVVLEIEWEKILVTCADNGGAIQETSHPTHTKVFTGSLIEAQKIFDALTKTQS